MANGEDEDPIDPLEGRIIGAGSNNLQRSLDALNHSVQRLLTQNAGGVGGGGGGIRPPVVAAGAASPAPRQPGNAIVPRGNRFPAPVSWDDNDTIPNPVYQWGTPYANRRAALPTPVVHAANQQVAAMTPASPNGWQWAHATYPGAFNKNGGGGSGGGGNFRSNVRMARRWVSNVQSFGNAMLKMALPMDNYAQWAAILAGSPVGPDGTDGRTVNSIRKFMFGSQGQNQMMWAQNAQDASNAAFIATRNAGMSPIAAGSNSRINPAFANYLGNIKDLSILNPMMNASDTANVMGTLTSTRGLYSAMMFGYRPVLGPGGTVDRNALGAFSDSVMRSAYGKTSVGSRNLAASLGQNGILNANIQAYVNAAGGDEKTVQALEDYITGRNTAMQHGVTGDEFDKLMAAYEKGGSGADAAAAKLKKLGISNSILQSQKDLGAAKAENVSDLLDSFGPAIKKANEALADFYDVLDRIVSLPGLKQILGYGGAFGSVFGGAANTALGFLGGAGFSRVFGGALGGGGGGAGVGGMSRALGLAGRGGPVAAAAALWGFSATSGWKDAGDLDHQDSPTRKALQTITPIGTARTAGSWGHRLWDKARGNNGESWVGVANPFGDEKRTTKNDGVGGGASAATGGGARTGGSGSSGSGGAVIGKSAAGAIRAALAEIGKPYQWGGTGPDSWDCSGLMQHAYAAIGVRIPRTSEQQMTVGEGVDRKDVRPGDLMFPYSGHVVMYIGGGKIVEAPRTGENVRTASVNEYGRYVAIRRIVGSVGNIGDLSTAPKTSQKQMSDTYGGNSGSPVMGSGNYGSVEEVDAISSALASVSGAVSGAPQRSSATSASATTSGSWKKDAASVQRAKALGQQLASQLYHWSGREWDALDRLFTGESGWRWWAENPSSHAYGIVQSLPGSKMASVGKDWRTNPATQLKWGMKYIHDRYGDPINALNQWTARKPHWYDTGAWNIPDDQVAMVHKGEMIIERPKADTIRNALMRDVVNVKSPSGTRTATGGHGITLVFNKDSIHFTVSGAMTESSMQSAANSFVQALANDARMKTLAKGQ